MSTTPSAPPAVSRMLLVTAAAACLLALVSAVTGSLGLLPAPVVVVALVGAASVAVRILLVVQARRSASAAGVLRILSFAGLGLSGFAALATIVSGLRTGDPGAFALDAVVQGWTLALLLAAAVPVRTLGWTSLLGVGLAGFLAVPALARAVGAPVVDALGVDAPLATSVWVPGTEEVLKAAPIAVVALLAARHRHARPAALDLTLLGAASGAGFALLEDLQVGRVTADPAGALPFTLLVPGMQQLDGTGWAGHVAGHLVWTALLAAGIGFGVLYRRRFRLAWAAIPVALLVVVVEHGTLNAADPPAALLVLTADGLLSTLLLVTAVTALIVLERRPAARFGDLAAGVRVRPASAAVHRASLATRQQRPAPEARR